MIKGVVFDLDHTLFDRYATLTRIAPYFCSYFDVRDGVTAETLAPLWCEADRQCVHLGWQAVIDYLARREVFRTVPTLSVYSKFVLGMFRRIAVPFDCTASLLDTLHAKGYKLGLITNGNSDIQRGKLRILGIEEKFDYVLITGEFGVHKPNPEPFAFMAKKLDAAPCELLYVGDNPLNDVDASRNAGYEPVWVRTTGTWVYPEIEKPKLQIDHVRQLPALLTDLG